MSVESELTEEQVQAFLADLGAVCAKHKIGLRGLSVFDVVWLAPLPTTCAFSLDGLYDDGQWQLR